MQLITHYYSSIRRSLTRSTGHDKHTKYLSLSLLCLCQSSIDTVCGFIACKTVCCTQSQKTDRKQQDHRPCEWLQKLERNRNTSSYLWPQQTAKNESIFLSSSNISNRLESSWSKNQVKCSTSMTEWFVGLIFLIICTYKWITLFCTDSD